VKNSNTTGLTALALGLKAAGLSQADVARFIGTSRAWVHDVVHGRAHPSQRFQRDVAALIARRVGLDTAAIRDALFSHPDQSDQEGAA